MKIWLDDNEVLMYSTYNECKSIVAERFIRTFKAKIYKKMIAIIIENLILVIWTS